MYRYNIESFDQLQSTTNFIMNTLAIFCLIAVAAVTAETSERRCKTNADCKYRRPLGIRYHCLPDLKFCYATQVTSPSPSDKRCRVDQDCHVEGLVGVKSYCDTFSRICFSRPVIPQLPSERSCRTVKDCYRAPFGYPNRCNRKTGTCFSRSNEVTDDLNK